MHAQIYGIAPELYEPERLHMGPHDAQLEWGASAQPTEAQRVQAHIAWTSSIVVSWAGKAQPCMQAIASSAITNAAHN